MDPTIDFPPSPENGADLTLLPTPENEATSMTVDDLRRAFPNRALFRKFLRTAPRSLRVQVFGGLYGKGLRKMFAAK